MKILVCAWRHWTAGRHFRSFLLNAPKQGHEVVGLATDWLADQDLTIAAFNELGVEAFPKENWKRRIGQLDPDVLFAEYRICPLERTILDWTNDQGKVGLFISHQPYIVSAHDYPEPTWTQIYYLVTSQQKATEATTAPRQWDRLPWPEDRTVVLGCPDLDFVIEKVDTIEVRERLGVKPDQPLIGLFPTIAQYAGFDEIAALVGKCQEAGWQVIVHNHPIERRLQNKEPQAVSPGSAPALNWDGFYVYDRKRMAAQVWPKLQAMGARFIVDYAPGRIGGVEFHRCQSFELMLAADCLIGGFDPFYEAYALGKGYTLFRSRVDFLMNHPPYPYREVLDPDFESQDNFTKVSSIVERGNDLEQDPAFVEKWFFKLDGLWWKRALDLAEQLVGDNA